MTRRFICRQNHEWEVLLDPEQAVVELACPVCGTADFTCLQEQPAAEESRGGDSETGYAPPLPGPGWSLPRLPGYDVVAELGHGGMGIVYKAFDRRRRQMIALKTLQSFTPAALYRFKQEFRTLAEVTHPNLITLFEPISDGHQWYFTMELIEGVDFLRHVREDQFASGRAFEHLPSSAQMGDRTATWKPSCSPVSTAGQIGRLRDALRQLAKGVTALHEAGKLHRDIKPSNVLVTPQGRVVLLDFGLAAALGPLGRHQSSERHLAGTLPYMSPEQVACQPLSAASDWYSVGVMLYEALTGHLPFEGKVQDVLQAKQEREPPPPGSLVADVPEDLEALCMQLLQRRPEARPSGRDILQTLEGTTIAAPAHAPTSPTMGVPFLGRRRQLAALRDAFEAVGQGHTMTVLVHGPSGMGKSRLVRHFLDAEITRNEVVVLTGRCYERASVPYKALDSLVDDLSGYLRRLPDTAVPALLPRDVLLLARVFPILRRVPAVAAAPGRAVDLPDAHGLRRRAFAALRELLARLGDRRRLILFIDDLQWGDDDSGLLLAELVRPPDAPVLLLVVGYRREDSDASPCVRALREAQEGPGGANRCCEVAVDALEETEACDLARVLLGEKVPAGQAEAIARESEGNPLFVQELVQYLHEGDERRAVTLEEVLWARIERLEPAERQLLEVVSVAGRPLSQALARQAAGVETDERALVARLRAGRLLRSTGSVDREEVETYHDRVRETMTAHLSADTLAAHHGRLARVLEASGEPDLDLLGVHLERAGEPGQAGAYFARAAEQAAQALAFDRAARLYRRSLELRNVQDDEERGLRIGLAEALANAGRGPESAREYLEAANGAGADEALDLRRRAALRLLTCGHYQEGLQTLRPLLDAVGLGLPSSPGRALWSLLLLRLRLRLRGLDFSLRSPEEISPEVLRYIDVCWAVGVGLFPLDMLSSWVFLTRGLLRALAAGDSLRIARGLALEASFLVSMGGRRRGRLVAQALEKADRLAREGNHPTASGLVLLARGMAAFSDGCWADACDLYDQSEAVFRERGVGVAFEINLARLYSLFALYYRGEIPEIRRRATTLYREARERGDFLTTLLVGLVKLYGPLAADDPEGVRRELAEIREHCPEQGVELLRHNVRIWELNLDLYRGDGAAALRQAGRPATAMEDALVRRSRYLRIPWHYKYGCCILAAAETAADRGVLVRSAVRCAQRLRRENLPWADGLAGLLRAGAAACRGDRSGACTALEEAIAIFEKVGMPLHAAVARRRLGECLAGARRDRLIDEADAAMAERDIRNPIRMTALYAPGFEAKSAARLAGSSDGWRSGLAEQGRPRKLSGGS